MNLEFGRDPSEDSSSCLCVAAAVIAHLGQEDPLSQQSTHILASCARSWPELDPNPGLWSSVLLCGPLHGFLGHSLMPSYPDSKSESPMGERHDIFVS